MIAWGARAPPGRMILARRKLFTVRFPDLDSARMTIPTLKFANGDVMPALGLGTWKADPGEVGEAVKAALDIGYRHFDCAAVYGNEKEVGAALAEAIASGQVKRGDLFITSKLWNNAHLGADVLPALQQTLADLRLDYLDLYLMHWPIAHRPDVFYPQSGDDFLTPEQAPLEDTWAALESCADAGLCRHLGVSNFNPKRLLRLIDNARIRPEVDQVESQPLLAQKDLLEICREHGVIFTAYSPLGSPDRPARLQRGDDPPLLKAPMIEAIARKHAITPAQVILAWAICRGTSVIPKSVTPARLAENFAAASVELNVEDMAALDTLEQGHRFLDGSFWGMDGSPYTKEWLWES